MMWQRYCASSYNMLLQCCFFAQDDGFLCLAAQRLAVLMLRGNLPLDSI